MIYTFYVRIVGLTEADGYIARYDPAFQLLGRRIIHLTLQPPAHSPNWVEHPCPGDRTTDVTGDLSPPN